MARKFCTTRPTGGSKVVAPSLDLPVVRLATYPREIHHLTSKDLKKYRIDSKTEESAEDGGNM